MYINKELELSTILSNCCRNKRISQNALYKKYYAYGMSIAIRYVDSKEEALTILNDAFLTVFNNLHKFDLAKPYKPWFRRILVNTAINFVRSRKKHNREVKLEVIENIPQTYSIENQINYQELIATLQHLSTAYREVFNLYVIDGFKHQEIAELLDISVSTSKSNLTRARQKLRVLVMQRFKERA